VHRSRTLREHVWKGDDVHGDRVAELAHQREQREYREFAAKMGGRAIEYGKAVKGVKVIS
jgi:hypothetical protein